MGMELSSHYQVNYLEGRYGRQGKCCLQALNTLNLWDAKALEALKQSQLCAMKYVLHCEKGIEASSCSLSQLIEHKEFLLSLNKEVDYAQGVFIPNLLDILEDNPLEKYPNTASLLAVNMHMSAEGMKRWQYVIENELEFPFFKHFEHLTLSEEQRARLTNILQQREAHNTVKNVSQPTLSTQVYDLHFFQANPFPSNSQALNEAGMDSSTEHIAPRPMGSNLKCYKS